MLYEFYLNYFLIIKMYVLDKIEINCVQNSWSTWSQILYVTGVYKDPPHNLGPSS